MSDHAHSQPHGASSHGAHEQGHDDHHGGLGKYVYVFIALCLLTAASFWTYADWPVKWPYHDTPAVGWAFMLAVASTKAMLVILFFMHVKYEASWKYVLTIPPGIMALLLMCALIPDVGLRLETAAGGRRPTEESLSRMANPAAEAEHFKLENKAHAEEAGHH
jgi:cytochrome c oxidase subunit 4